MIMNELEGRVKAPTASPERLLALVGNISSSSVEARQLSHDMSARIHAIAEHHEGEVPLHGRLFAQWLHYAFPNECAFPQIAESSVVLTPSAWLDSKAIASQEEKDQHIHSSELVEEMPNAPMAQWTDHEVLIAHEPSVRRYSTLGSILRITMQVFALFAVIRAGLAAWRSAGQAFCGGNGSGKENSFMLPIHHHTI